MYIKSCSKKYKIHIVSPQSNTAFHSDGSMYFASKAEHLITPPSETMPTLPSILFYLLPGYRTKKHRISRAVPRSALPAKVELEHKLLRSPGPLSWINPVPPPPPPARLACVCVFPIHEAHVLVRGHGVLLVLSHLFVDGSLAKETHLLVQGTGRDGGRLLRIRRAYVRRRSFGGISTRATCCVSGSHTTTASMLLELEQFPMVG